MDLSDWFGLAGSLLLLVAPARDQMARFRIGRLRRLPIVQVAGDRQQTLPTVSVEELSLKVEHALDRARNRWRFSDSATMGLGAIMLAISFVL